MAILSLFLDIPDKAVKYLYNKCESYISNLQQGEDDEIASEMQELEKQEEDELNKSLMTKTKKKKFKITNRSSQSYIIIFFIIVIIVQVYYVFNYLISESLLSNTL